MKIKRLFKYWWWRSIVWKFNSKFGGGKYYYADKRYGNYNKYKAGYFNFMYNLTLKFCKKFFPY